MERSRCCEFSGCDKYGRTSMKFGWSALAIWFVNSILQLWINPVDSTTLAPIYWTHNNPMFKTSKNDHVIEVKLYDDIDYVCPHVEPRGGHEPHHLNESFFIVYMVSRNEYEDCNIYSENRAMVMLNCSNPNRSKRFTIIFEPFQSIPNAPEYQPGSTYYFITTSTGSRDGLGNLYQGACYQHNMKLMIKVCCDASSTGIGKDIKNIHINTVSEPKVIVHRQPSPNRLANNHTRHGTSLSDRHGTSRHLKNETQINKLRVSTTSASFSAAVARIRSSSSTSSSIFVPRSDEIRKSESSDKRISEKYSQDLDTMMADDVLLNARHEGLVNTGSSLTLSSCRHFLLLVCSVLTFYISTITDTEIRR